MPCGVMPFLCTQRSRFLILLGMTGSWMWVAMDSVFGLNCLLSG